MEICLFLDIVTHLTQFIRTTTFMLPQNARFILSFDDKSLRCGNAHNMPYYYRCISPYNNTPAATDKFNELTLPCIGIETVTSQVLICCLVKPFCSLPNINVQGFVESKFDNPHPLW